MGVRAGDLLTLLSVERTDDHLTLTCICAGEVTVIQGGLHGRYYGGLTFVRFGTDIMNTGPSGMIDFVSRDESGRYFIYSVYSDDLERCRLQLRGAEIEDEMLPELEAFELELDGSVTLTLSSPRYGTAFLSFGETCLYRLTKLRVTLPVFEMLEALTFCLVNRDGSTFHLKARTTGARKKHGQIMAHLEKRIPKPEAAVTPYPLQHAA